MERQRNCNSEVASGGTSRADYKRNLCIHSCIYVAAEGVFFSLHPELICIDRKYMGIGMVRCVVDVVFIVRSESFEQMS